MSDLSTFQASSTTHMIHPLKMVGSAFTVQSLFEVTETFQWVRELAINGCQADAKNIFFGALHQDFNAYESKKNKETCFPFSMPMYRTVADDGHGMTKDELTEHINSFGSTAARRAKGGREKNKGAGARITIVPWNKRGAVWVTRTNGGPTLMLAIVDDGNGEVGAVADFHQSQEVNIPISEWPGGDPQIVMLDEFEGFIWEGIDWTKVLPPSSELPHGTTVVLLGNDDNVESFFGTPGRSEGGKYSLIQYLQAKFPYEINGVKIASEEYETEVDGSRKIMQRRFHDPLTAYLDRGTRSGESRIQAQGFMQLEGPIPARLDWWMLKADEVDESRHNVSAPTIGYVAEMHDGFRETVGFEQNGTAERKLKPFIPFAPVRRRVYFLITPQAEVYMDMSRRGLMYTDISGAARALPEAEWADYFLGHQPEEILAETEKARLAAVSGSDLDLSEEMIKRLAGRFTGYFTTTVEAQKKAPRERTRMTTMTFVTTVADTEMESGGSDLPILSSQAEGSANPNLSSSNSTLSEGEQFPSKGEGETGGDSERPKTIRKAPKPEASEHDRYVTYMKKVGLVNVSLTPDLSVMDAPWHPATYDAESKTAYVNMQHPFYQAARKSVFDTFASKIAEIETVERRSGKLIDGEESEVSKTLDVIFQTAVKVQMTLAISHQIQQYYRLIDNPEITDKAAVQALLEGPSIGAPLAGINAVESLVAGPAGELFAKMGVRARRSR